MTKTYKASICVIGAGPVGMSVAIAASMRGVDVVLVEAREAGQPPSAKCNTVAARTLETFRQFGVSEQVRNAGLTDSYPTDVIYCTSITGPEITRIPLPSRDERQNPGYIDSAWQTPEPMVRVSQLYMEPILFNRVKSAPEITVLNQTQFIHYQDDADGVTVHCEATDGEAVVIQSRFLVGCDGGRSAVRKQMGVQLEGDAELGRTRSSLIRAPGLKALFGKRRPAWMSWIVNEKIRGNVVAINGEDVWLVHRSVPAGEEDFETLDFDQSIRDVLGVGPEFTWELLNHEDWVGRRLVANRFRQGNVFIAGDAAHLWVPFAGYGMNAGVADGFNLAWMLSAVLNGWGGPNMLEAYEAERRPITEQVSKLAIAKVMENLMAMGNGKPPEALSANNPVGWGIRKIMGKKLYDMNVPQFAPEGLNFGYFYVGSPIIVYDGAEPPLYTMGEITPSTVPGCRLPHFTVAGKSAFDLMGLGYTLFRFDRAIDVQSIVDEAAGTSVPMTLVDVDTKPSPAFTTNLVIARADHQIAWRGDRAPQDAWGLVATLRGIEKADVASPIHSLASPA